MIVQQIIILLMMSMGFILMVYLQPVSASSVPCIFSICDHVIETPAVPERSPEPSPKEVDYFFPCCEPYGGIERRVTLGYNTGSYISLDKSYGSLGVIFPLGRVNSWHPFMDVRAFCLDDGKWAGSGGMGARRWMNERLVVGVNTFLDYRRGQGNDDFFQAGVGLEWLTPSLDIRFNGYIPVGSRGQTIERASYTWPGGFQATCHELEFSYSGFDLEAGLPLCASNGYRLYATGGTYFLCCPEHSPFWGIEGGLEASWRSLISAGVRVTHDRHYSTKVQGIFSLTLPLDCLYGRSCFDIFNQPIRRNPIILTHECCDWTWNW